jgi:hypothetical protein
MNNGVWPLLLNLNLQLSPALRWHEIAPDFLYWNCTVAFQELTNQTKNAQVCCSFVTLPRRDFADCIIRGQ